MFTATEFTGECTFCYSNVKEESIIYCSCGTEMCAKDEKKHRNSKHQRIGISVSGDIPNITVKIEDFGNSVDKKTIKNQVKQSLLLPKIEGGKLKKCKHIPSVEKLVLTDKKCCECDINSNSWMCVACGKVFCGREQYGVEGKGHGMEHYTENKEHPVFVKVQSIDKDTEMCDAFCYKCDEMITHDLYTKIEDKTEEKKEDVSNMLEISKKLNTKAEELSFDADGAIIPYSLILKEGSIYDLGNSCYISSVLQALSYSLSDFADELVAVYETQCERPKECFGCQFTKVMTHLNLSHREKTKSFSVERLYSIVEGIYPKYVLGTQQDASEYFTDLLSLVSSYNEMGHFSGIYNRLKITQEIQIVCDRCNSVTKQEETGPIVYIGSEQKVSSLFAEEELPVICDCGEQSKKRKTKIVNAPSVFTVGIKRGTEEHSSVEPEKKFTLLDIDKKERKYKLETAVIYRGTVQAGHYIAQAPVNLSKIGEIVYNQYKEKEEDCEKDRSSKNKKCKKEEIDEAEAWIVHDNEKSGIQRLLLSEATVLFYKLQNE